MRTRLLAFAFSLAVVALAPSAAAQDDPRKARAEAIFADGLKLHDAGKDELAIAKYREAYEVYRSPNILFAIARLEQLLHQPLAAIRHYREAMKSPILHPRNQDLGKTYIAELEKVIVRVDVKAPAGVVFMLGGKKLVAPLEEPVDLEPGTISVEGTLGDARYVGSARGAAGTSVVVELRSADGGAMSVTFSPSAPNEPYWNGRRIAGAVTALVGVGVAVGGVVSLGAASSHDDKAGELRGQNPGGCSVQPQPPICNQIKEEVDAKDSATGLGWGLLVTGGVVFAVGTTLVLWPSSSGPRGSIEVRPRLSGLSVSGTF